MTQIAHDFILPNPTTIKTADGRTLQIYDAQSLGRTINRLQAAVDSLSGKGTNGTQATGPLNMNSNPVTGITNSAAPTSDEAVSYGLAQAQYTVFRPSITNQQANYQIKATDGTVRAQAAQVPVNQQLPPASTVLGKCFTIKKTDTTANAVLVTTSRDPVSGNIDSIDGQPQYSLTAYNKYVTVQAVATGVYDVVANN